MNIDATYSPEDNKIRLYPSERLDQELYNRVKDAGFKWAPKQELFVAPRWTPAREDLAIELAGEIEPEEMTLAERAQAKAERLDGYAEKRLADANAYRNRANDISRRFADGQPILAGHHSERKARKDQERMQSAQSQAVKNEKTSQYWLYRASGVEHYANMKNNPRVRANRIQTLLKELRDHQRQLNEAASRLEMWRKVESDAIILRLAFATIKYETAQKLENGEITSQEMKERAIASYERAANSEFRKRFIDHILNRLSFERSMLGDVPRFEGELTPVILQTFLREHGAEKPKGEKLEDNFFSVKCPVPVPLHLGNGDYIELTGDEWRDLMHSVGYRVPDKKPAKPPLINIDVEQIQTENRWNRGKIDTYNVISLTKAEYSAINSECRGTILAACGTFRVKTCLDPNWDGPRYQAPRVAVFLTDSKQHDLPESLTQGAEVA